MLRRTLWAVAVMVCILAPLALQAQEQYLDVFVVNVRPEKSSDFDALVKKMAAANRKNNGDRWLAVETVYGDSNTVAFISTRTDYASIDKGTEAFMSALNKAYTKDGADKMMRDWNLDVAGSHSELRRRRFDLSRKVPSSPEDYAKMIASSRVLRTTVVHVKPGHIDDFEAMMKDAKAAGESNPNTQPLLVSQLLEGGRGNTFYVTSLRSSLGGFDNNPTMKDILGEEGYKKWQQSAAGAIDGTESAILRFSPELSSPPEQILAAAPDYWNPKPVVAAAKPKSKGVENAAEKQTAVNQ